MIRPFLISCGSRGDVEPFAALATGLAKLKNVDKVAIMVPSMYMHLAPQSPKITIIPFNMMMPKNAFPGNVPVKSDGSLASFDNFTEKKILPNANLMLDEARKLESTLVVSSVFTIPISDLIRDVLQIPHLSLHLQPSLRSAYYPEMMQLANAAEMAKAYRRIQTGDIEGADSKAYFASHSFPLAEGLKAAIPHINKLRAEHSLPPTDFERFMELFNATLDNTYAMIATQSLLTPLPPDASSRVHIVGSFSASYLPDNWDPNVTQRKLGDFLAAGPKPVVVTYGSMGAGFKSQEVTRTILRGLRAAKVERVVIVPGNAQLGLNTLDETKDSELLEWAKDRVFTTEGNVQYAWLFPQCEMVMCHCGAGTTAAAFQAGIPILGTPVFADQPFYIELLSLMNIGLRVGNLGLGSITEEAVLDGVTTLREKGAIELARNIGEKQRALGEDINKACKVVTMISEASATK